MGGGNLLILSKLHSFSTEQNKKFDQLTIFLNLFINAEALYSPSKVEGVAFRPGACA